MNLSIQPNFLATSEMVDGGKLDSAFGRATNLREGKLYNNNCDLVGRTHDT